MENAKNTAGIMQDKIATPSTQHHYQQNPYRINFWKQQKEEEIR